MKFEDNLKKLENIALKIKDENQSLDETISSFEEGVSIANELEKILESYEKRVQILINKDGKDYLEEFK